MNSILENTMGKKRLYFIQARITLLISARSIFEVEVKLGVSL